MSGFTSDLRVVLRTLSRTPGFAVAAIGTLGLGMATAIAALLLVKAYLFTALPYPAADRLYDVRYAAPGQQSPAEMETLDWASLSDVAEEQIAWDLDAFYLIGGAQAEMVPGAWVTPGFLQGLGIRPAIGRGLDASAFAPGAGNSALISHRLWTSRFGANPGIVGRTFSAYVSDRPQEAETFTIVGVLPSGFWHVNVYTDVIVPLRAPTYPYMVRVREGVSSEQLGSRIGALVRSGAHRVPDRWAPLVTPSHSLYVLAVRPILRAVSFAAVLVLLVACANVAGLLVVRATRRQREVAVRAALGAGRGRIARLLLLEALVLGTCATTLAMLTAHLLLGSLAPAIQQQLGRRVPGGLEAFALDGWSVTATVLTGLATVVICTLVPLAAVARPALAGTLQSSGRSATEGRSGRRLRSSLITLEIAVSLALLGGSALMLRTVAGLAAVDLGFNADRVLLASITLRQNRYPDVPARHAMFEGMALRLSSLPGARSAGLTTAWPMQAPRPVAVSADASRDDGGVAGLHFVNDAYFDALQIPIAAGRAFTSRDRTGSALVALVSESLARRLWPSGDAVSRTVVVDENRGEDAPLPVARTVVGVVRDVRQGPHDTDLADVYVPILQSPGRFAFVLLRTDGDPSGSIAALRAAVYELDREVVVQTARPLRVAVDETAARPRAVAWLLSSFAMMATVLALIGVFGVVSHAVRQREREIAIRMALGADPARLTRLFVRQGIRVLALGVTIGLAGALGTGRLIESQLFGVTASDPIALAGAAAAFAAVGVAAIWWPSRRAAATDPAIALRAE
jgi:putative ABC transport system permease protein